MMRLTRRASLLLALSLLTSAATALRRVRVSASS
jgi:hypothetical protein